MGCFCHQTPLAGLLPQLNVNVSVSLPGANIPLSLSAWLNARSLPCLPWQPDPNWLNLPLPKLQLGVRAVATISAMASLRAQVLAQFGLDLLIPAQARAFARIVATMNARLSLMANINPLGWIRLAGLNSAIDQVTIALNAGLFAPPANLLLSLTMPGGLPMARWGSFLSLLGLLAPMIAASAQLNVSLSETAQLSAALRMLARLSLPPLAAPELMASLTAALSAIASLHASLGINPLALGLPAVQIRIQAKLAALLPALSAHFGLNLGGGGDLLGLLLSLLPKLPALPTSLATTAVVQAALSATAIASLNWQVSVMPPAIAIGLPTCALVAQLQAALAINAVLSAPCPMCDAAKLMQAL
ncbi:MAG TPA: hypothetical protein VLI93_07755 [Acetobacteraceae bacterium]|nr:hypothetical protein [Acetobacteraceae bacterium]